MGQVHCPHGSHPLLQQVRQGSLWVHWTNQGGGEGWAHRQQLFRLPGHCREEAPAWSQGTACPAPHQNIFSRTAQIWKWLLWSGHRTLLGPPNCSPMGLRLLCWVSCVLAPLAGSLKEPLAKQAILSPLLLPWSWHSHRPARMGQAWTCRVGTQWLPGAVPQQTAPTCLSAACPNASPGPPRLQVLLLWGAC